MEHNQRNIYAKSLVVDASDKLETTVYDFLLLVPTGIRPWRAGDHFQQAWWNSCELLPWLLNDKWIQTVTDE